MKKQIALLMLMLLAGGLAFLQAQPIDEDQQMMRQYKLPEQAVPEADLIVRDSLATYEGLVYTGTVYTRYANGQLQTAVQYVNGLKHGQMLVWYPDGKAQLISNYRKGHLNGRFKGWYQFGGVIYDLVMKDNAYAGDQMYDDDSTRETTSGSDDEPTADGIDKSND